MAISEEGGFVERRNNQSSALGRERRQFSDSYQDLSPGARELATAIDAYKLHHRRRFINYEEMLQVILGLGYQKTKIGEPISAT